jgi:hypothetical protein
MTKIDEKMKTLNVRHIFDNPPAPTDPAPAFAALEKDLGARLPDDYKAFASTYGHHGFEQYVGVPVEPRFPLGKTCLVSVIFGCQPQLRYFLPNERSTYRDRMPHHLLPIARDPGGNLFVLSLGELDQGAVYYWDHDHVELPKTRVEEMANDLEEEGVDTSQMFIDGIIMAWEERHQAEIDRPPGYGNLYLVGESFAAFVNALHPYDPEAA